MLVLVLRQAIVNEMMEAKNTSLTIFFVMHLVGGDYQLAFCILKKTF